MKKKYYSLQEFLQYNLLSHSILTFCQNVAKTYFSSSALDLQGGRRCVAEAIVHCHLNVKCKALIGEDGREKGSGSQILHNNPSCWKSMPRNLTLFHMTYLIHSGLVSGCSECLAAGVRLRGDDLSLNTRIPKQRHTPTHIYRNKVSTHPGRQARAFKQTHTHIHTHKHLAASLFCSG